MTKNIIIRENQIGFVVRNNNKVVKTTRSYQEAEKIALEIANKENKGVIAKTDYINRVVKKA